MTALSVRGLGVTAHVGPLVIDVSFELERGGRLGLIGESGSGKSVTGLAILGLLPEGLTARGEVILQGERLTAMTERRRSALRGDRIGMVFQEPMTALNPTMRVGKQIAEVLQLHRGERRALARSHALDLLQRVELPDPEHQARLFPHQLSGGQRQRVVLAMAIACDPAVVIADEPTTALDVTVQAQMLQLMSRLVSEENAALLLISHDLAVISAMCDRVMVMYGGRVVESGSTAAVLRAPQHPYTAGLRATAAAVTLQQPAGRRELPSIPGHVPSAGAFPSGCPFRSRCERASERCQTMPPRESHGDHDVACWHPVRPTAGMPTSGVRVGGDAE
jgi:peptide/nickel transport system ATP-binding protein